MRLSSQNNQFVFNLPSDFITTELENRLNLVLEQNLSPYDSVMDYINSTIKEIVFPSYTLNSVTQTHIRGKKIDYKDATPIYDNFNRELDITFRSVDSHTNYFMLLEMIIDYSLRVSGKDYLYMPDVSLEIIDNNGFVIYTVLFDQIILKGLSENRLNYNATDVSEKPFTLTFSFNFIEIKWGLKEKKSDKDKDIFDKNIVLPNPRKI